ncbi:LysE family translocator [Streptomyces buecherae]|uniref:LysE family translocator n=1 Tax=Streptomyces buecherae TaxID=2763006 RepID=UPI0037A4C80A
MTAPPSSIVSFAGIAALLVMAPGVDFALVLRASLISRRRGLISSLGVASGLVLHTGLAVAGVSALLMTSTAQFWLYLVSGVFLVYLGARGLVGLSAELRRGASSAPAAGESDAASDRSAYQRGFLVNALNPKAPVLFLSIMPQFVPERGDNLMYTTLLGSIVVICALVWFPLVAITSHRLSRWLSRPSVSLMVNTVTAGVILTLGIRQLLELL